MDREAWRAVVHGVAKSWTLLSEIMELAYYENSVRCCHMLVVDYLFSLKISYCRNKEGN